MVEKTNFQDLYLQLKERHKHLDSRKQKEGFNKLMDTKRHVWKVSHDSLKRSDSAFDLTISKDVAVATFLMLLWRDMYPSRHLDTPNLSRPWDTWGRPSSGFLDLGCGNALLVHILITEGYTGRGIELRERRTWPTYPEATRNSLEERGIDPPKWFPRTMSEWEKGEWEGKDECPVREGMFLIGNHADEMTVSIPSRRFPTENLVY